MQKITLYKRCCLSCEEYTPCCSCGKGTCNRTGKAVEKDLEETCDSWSRNQSLSPFQERKVDLAR